MRRNQAKWILILLGLLFWLQTMAQEKKYWQQSLSYKIEVRLNDKQHSLHGKETIVYKNQSPDELTFLLFHLWPNAYKSENTALCKQLLLQGNTSLYYAPDSLRGYIDSLDFSIENQKLVWNYDSQNEDIAKIVLPKPLKPGDSAVITTPFYVKIPASEFSRLGHHEQSYQITQWYPKPAVYDQQGWHAMPYLNTGEFYSEFANFDVKISLPSNYRVGATGDLIENETELAWIDSIAQSTTLKHIFSDDLSFPPSSPSYKTLHFHQEKVHDFAWFADKRYHILKGEVELNSGEKVKVFSLFTNQEADLWKNSLQYISQATRFYSDKVGNYPYQQVSAVQGALSAGAGMEYPNITIIGSAGSARQLEEVIMHEVGHNWFYGLLGFNERDFPWMDEGLNTFYENLYMRKFHPDLKLLDLYTDQQLPFFHLQDYPSGYEYYLVNRFLSAYNLSQAPNLPSTDYSEFNYGAIVYYKTTLLFLQLRAYLGADSFDALMRNFFVEWQYKHPQPEDFIKFFKENSGKDLSWFFDDLLGSTATIDYKIKRVSSEGDSLLVEIKNKGLVNAPIHLTALNAVGQTIESQWYDGFSNNKIFALPKGAFSTILINHDYEMLDYNPNNNFYHPQKLLPKTPSLKVKWLSALPKYDELHWYFTPIIGWNNYNHGLFGILLANHSAFEKKWELEAIPLYSFHTKSIIGSANAQRNLYPHGKLRRISIGVRAKSYNYQDYHFQNAYRKLSPEITFYYRNPAGNAHIQHFTKARGLWIDYDRTEFRLNQNNTYEAQQSRIIRRFMDLKHSYENNRPINPWAFHINLENLKTDLKAQIDFQYTISYLKPKKGLFIRVFVGNFFHLSSQVQQDPFLDNAFKMSAWDGGDDYTYDYTYIGRSEYSGLWSAQMVSRDGGFYLPSALGRSKGFIASLNTRVSLPFTNLVKLYFNLGMTQETNSLSAEIIQTKLYEGGFVVSIIDHHFEVYIPALWSQRYTQVMSLNPNYTYWSNIRFSMRLDLLDPFVALKKLNL